MFETSGGFCPFDGTGLKAGSGSDSQIQREYESLLGTTLDGRYRVERRLGEGGMGVVLLARHMVIDKPVAIKVLKREVASDKGLVKRFVQEARAASRIGHPNIVDVTDFGSSADGPTYQVMEYIEGITLNEVIDNQGPQPAARCLPIAAQIARALGAAHDKGIIHRDLKPENVFLVNRDGRRDFVKIVDFGIAKVQPVDQARAGPRLTRAGSVFGTPEYMAPEQASGRSDADHRVDIYALGIILYEMLVGKVPLKGETTVRTIAMQILEPIKPPRALNAKADVSDALEAVIMKALAKKPDDRYASMAELVTSLEGLAAGGIELNQPVSASAVSPPAPPSATTLVEGPVTEIAPGPPTAALAHAAEVERQQEQTRRRVGDPAFVARKKPPTVDDLTPDTIPVAEERRARWPIVVAALAALAAAVVAVVLIARSMSERGAAPAAAVAAAAPARPPAKAGAEVATPAAAIDAGTEPAPGEPALDPPRDAGSTRPGEHHASAGRRRDAGPTPAAGGRQLVEVKVMSIPAGAGLYVNHSYRGEASAESGVRFSRPLGTVLEVTCELPGYKTRKISVKFDGSDDIAVCKLARSGKCVEGLKSPFDKCPEPEARP